MTTVFQNACVAAGIGKPHAEYRFCPGRKWSFDWAWPDYKIALEIEGGAFGGHGHRSVGRFLRDMEKYNNAAILSWRVLRVTTTDFDNGNALELVMRAVEASNAIHP